MWMKNSPMRTEGKWIRSTLLGRLCEWSKNVQSEQLLVQLMAQGGVSCRRIKLVLATCGKPNSSGKTPISHAHCLKEPHMCCEISLSLSLTLLYRMAHLRRALSELARCEKEWQVCISAGFIYWVNANFNPQVLLFWQVWPHLARFSFFDPI